MFRTYQLRVEGMPRSNQARIFILGDRRQFARLSD